MTGYTSTPEKLAAIRVRIALGKRIQPAQGRVLLEEIARLRAGRFVPTHHRELRALAQATVDAQYSGDDYPANVTPPDFTPEELARRASIIRAHVANLSGWLADHPEAP